MVDSEAIVVRILELMIEYEKRVCHRLTLFYDVSNFARTVYVNARRFLITFIIVLLAIIVSSNDKLFRKTWLKRFRQFN